MDYACIPQVACPIALSEEILPVEIRRGGGRFFASFRDIEKSYRTLPVAKSVTGDKPGEDEETKGEPRMNKARRATTDHRQSSSDEKGSSAKFWLREAVKVSQGREGRYAGVCYFMIVKWVRTSEQKTYVVEKDRE